MGRFLFHGSSFFLPLFPFVRWGSTKILQNPVALVFGRKLPVVRFSSSILSGFQLMQFDAFWQVLGEYLGGKVVKERMGMAWVIMADTCYPSCFNHEVHNIKPCHGNAWFMLFQKVGATPETWLKIIDTQTWIKMDAVRYTSMTLFFRGFRCLRDSSTSKTWGRPGRCSFSTTRNVQPEILPYIFLADAWAFFVTSAWCWNNQPLPVVLLGVQTSWCSNPHQLCISYI